jgi:hypothetical protein
MICPAVSPLARFKNAMPVDSRPAVGGAGPPLRVHNVAPDRESNG